MANSHKSMSFCISIILALHLSTLVEGSLLKHMKFNWGAQNSAVRGKGDGATLVLDQISGSGTQSKRSFLFGSIEMHIKLVRGHSAGTVTAYYLSSIGDKHDEIDFEFLGNVSGEPYVIHTNVYTEGAAGREQQFYPWFDPTTDYHNYTILWNPSHIVWYVDSIPIRVYKNYLSEGIPYPKQQAMRVYSSIWNADSWATRGGLDKIDWKKSPFVAKLTHFRPKACSYHGPASLKRCGAATPAYWWNSPAYSELSDNQRDQMKRVRNKYMIYDYCEDFKKYNGLFPGECFKPHYI